MNKLSLLNQNLKNYRKECNMYLELVSQKVTNRPGKCIHKQDLHKYRLSHQGKPLYRSTFLYKQPFEGSVSNYMQLYDIDNIILDIDYKSSLDMMEVVESYILDIEEYLSKEQYLVFFSGTGFHIMFSAKHFAFEPSNHLPRTVKATIDSIFDGVDLSIFNTTSIYRVSHTRNQKSGLYKIPLYHEELSKSYDEIKELAKQPRYEFDYFVYNPDALEDLSDLVIEKPVNLKETAKKVTEPKRIATCIHNILNATPVEGQRHPTALRVASHFRRSGVPSWVTIETLKEWLKQEPDKTEEEIRRIVDNTYNKGYQYSCKDAILARHCSPNCIYYNTNNYQQGVFTMNEIHLMSRQRMETDFSGVTLNLDELLHTQVDDRCYPGELITLFGLTGSGKTALAMQIADGKDIYGNTIQNLLPTLYISMEMSNLMMYRRFVQQVKGVNKHRAMEIIGNRAEPVEGLAHIMMRYISPNLNTIKKEINEYQPQLVIVDHLELLQSRKDSSRNKISEITQTLKQIALENDIIVLQLSQTSRGYARENRLDLYAGKESGTIEHDSDKVIGLWGNAESHAKKVQFFKNRDAEYNSEQYVTMNDSMLMTFDPEQQWDEEFERLKMDSALKQL